MAEYTNLTTLEGLQPGDVITYDTTTTIDFKGCKVRVVLYGASTSSSYRNTNSSTDYSVKSNGGISSFILDHSKLNGVLLTFNKENSITQATTANTKRCDLIYGETNSLYYRIAVAGSAGNSKLNYNTSHFGGGGGGVAGSNGNGSYPGGGGTQTSGGKKGDYYASAEAKGGFGTSGYYNYLNTSYTGGYGWYGGGAGAITSPGGGSGGGSGFIIGYTTTTYPAGYLDDNIELQIHPIGSGV